MSIYRRLSDAQKRNLTTLAERTSDGRWIIAGQYFTRTNTLESLANRGLAEEAWNFPTFKYRISEAGLALLAETAFSGS